MQNMDSMNLLDVQFREALHALFPNRKNNYQSKLVNNLQAANGILVAVYEKKDCFGICIDAIIFNFGAYGLSVEANSFVTNALCNKVRRHWHQLSDTERQQVAEAILSCVPSLFQNIGNLAVDKARRKLLCSTIAALCIRYSVESVSQVVGYSLQSFTQGDTAVIAQGLGMLTSLEEELSIADLGRERKDSVDDIVRNGLEAALQWAQSHLSQHPANTLEETLRQHIMLTLQGYAHLGGTLSKCASLCPHVIGLLLDSLCQLDCEAITNSIAHAALHDMLVVQEYPSLNATGPTRQCKVAIMREVVARVNGLCDALEAMRDNLRGDFDAYDRSEGLKRDCLVTLLVLAAAELDNACQGDSDSQGVMRCVLRMVATGRALFLLAFDFLAELDYLSAEDRGTFFDTAFLPQLFAIALHHLRYDAQDEDEEIWALRDGRLGIYDILAQCIDAAPSACYTALQSLVAENTPQSLELACFVLCGTMERVSRAARGDGSLVALLVRCAAYSLEVLATAMENSYVHHHTACRYLSSLSFLLCSPRTWSSVVGEVETIYSLSVQRCLVTALTPDRSISSHSRHRTTSSNEEEVTGSGEEPNLVTVQLAAGRALHRLLLQGSGQYDNNARYAPLVTACVDCFDSSYSPLHTRDSVMLIVTEALVRGVLSAYGDNREGLSSGLLRLCSVSMRGLTTILNSPSTPQSVVQVLSLHRHVSQVLRFCDSLRTDTNHDHSSNGHTNSGGSSSAVMALLQAYYPLLTSTHITYSTHSMEIGQVVYEAQGRILCCLSGIEAMQHCERVRDMILQDSYSVAALRCAETLLETMASLLSTGLVEGSTVLSLLHSLASSALAMVSQPSSSNSLQDEVVRQFAHLLQQTCMLSGVRRLLGETSNMAREVVQHSVRVLVGILSQPKVYEMATHRQACLTVTWLALPPQPSLYIVSDTLQQTLIGHCAPFLSTVLQLVTLHGMSSTSYQAIAAEAWLSVVIGVRQYHPEIEASLHTALQQVVGSDTSVLGSEVWDADHRQLLVNLLWHLSVGQSQRLKALLADVAKINNHEQTFDALAAYSM